VDRQRLARTLLLAFGLAAILVAVGLLLAQQGALP
jgi:Na+(H+)/acetate symporter ActP